VREQEKRKKNLSSRKKKKKKKKVFRLCDSIARLASHHLEVSRGASSVDFGGVARQSLTLFVSGQR